MKEKKVNTLSENAMGFLLDRGFNMADISRLLHVDRSLITRVCRGERVLSYEHLELLAKEFNMTMWEFITASTPADTVAPRLRKGFNLLVSGLKTSQKLLENLKHKSSADRHRKKRTG